MRADLLAERALKEYHEEIAVAERKLREQMLTDIVRDDKAVCDVYCIPSHGHQAFFFKLYENEDGYIALYAKTFVADRFGLTAMCTFGDCVKAQEHNGSVGRIICGVKRFPKSDMMITRLVSCLPEETEWVESGMMLDGEHTVIRNHLQEEIKLLSYRSNARFVKNAYPEAQKAFLEDLFLHIEDLIGNVLDHDL